jgi:hypothetical protein
VPRINAGVAQSVERLPCKQGVVGSTPTASSTPLCAHCHQHPRIAGQSYCRACNAAIVRAWRHRHGLTSAIARLLHRQKGGFRRPVSQDVSRETGKATGSLAELERREQAAREIA